MILLFQNINKLLITLIFALTVISAQPKLSFHLGSGFYKPSLGYLDPDSNSVIPSLSAFGKNILIDWGDKALCYRWLHAKACSKYIFLRNWQNTSDVFHG